MKRRSDEATKRRREPRSKTGAPWSEEALRRRPRDRATTHHATPRVPCSVEALRRRPRDSTSTVQTGRISPHQSPRSSPKRPRQIPYPFIAILTVLFLTTNSPADTRISLRTVARVPAGSPVTLNQIASIEGDDAAFLADLVVVPDPAAAPRAAGGWIEIDTARLRDLLAEQDVRIAALQLRGGTCAIIPTATAPKQDADAAPALQPDAPETPGGPVRDLIAATIARLLSVPPEGLRLAFDDRDREFLDRLAPGHTLDIKPAGISDRLPLTITTYNGDRVADTRTIRVGVLVHRPVLIPLRDIHRSEPITSDAVAAQRRWLPPTASPADPDRAIGRIATRTIRAEAVVEAHMVEPPVVIRRGDIVNIRCISGTILIELQRMRARRDGREGETIEFESTDGQRRRITATVDGPGRAVILAGAIGGAS